MIYPACRSPRKYLNRLREISSSSEKHHLISISGGLSFLQALGENTLSLNLVDSDREVNTYVDAVIEMILLCDARWKFFEMLTGYQSSRVSEGQLTFTKTLSPFRLEAENQLSSYTNIFLKEIYNPTNFNHDDCSISTKYGTIEFIPKKIAPMHFFWLSHWGALASEDSFVKLTNTLRRLGPHSHTMKLQDWDFATAKPNTYVLASNTDSPLFTQNDEVLNAIEASGNSQVYYISRTRDYSKPAQFDKQSFMLQNFNFEIPAIQVPADLRAPLKQKFPFLWDFINDEKCNVTTFYDEVCVAFYIGSQRDSTPPQYLKSLTTVTPICHRILFIGDEPSFSILNSFPWIKRYTASETFVINEVVAIVFQLNHRIDYPDLPAIWSN